MTAQSDTSRKGNASYMKTQRSGLSSLFSPLLVGTSCFWRPAPVAGWVNINPKSVYTACPISFLKQRSCIRVGVGGGGRTGRGYRAQPRKKQRKDTPRAQEIKEKAGLGQGSRVEGPGGGGQMKVPCSSREARDPEVPEFKGDSGQRDGYGNSQV